MGKSEGSALVVEAQNGLDDGSRSMVVQHVQTSQQQAAQVVHVLYLCGRQHSALRSGQLSVQPAG